MASYYTEVKVVNEKGSPVKAAITCGGTSKGSTDEKTGVLGFEMGSNGKFRISAKSGISGSASGEIKGGGQLVLRLKK